MLLTSTNSSLTRSRSINIYDTNKGRLNTIFLNTSKVDVIKQALSIEDKDMR